MPVAQRSTGVLYGGVSLGFEKIPPGGLIPRDISLADVMGKAAHRAARCALMSAIEQQAHSLQKIAVNMEKIRRRWAARVYALQDAGWGLSEKKTFSVANCALFGVFQRGPRYYCNRVHVCPWCWGRRRVSRLLKRLIELYRPKDGSPGETRSLLEVHTYCQYDRDRIPLSEAFDRMRALRTLHQDMLFRRREASAYWACTLEPGFRDEQGKYRRGWRVHHRMLAIVPEGFDRSRPIKWVLPYDDELEVHDRHLRWHDEITTQKQLIKIAGSVLRYPRYLLVAKPPEDTLEILREMKRRSDCWVSSYGAFRTRR